MSVDPLVPICAAGAAAAAGAAWWTRRVVQPLRWAGIPVVRWQLVGPPIPGSPLNELRVPASQFEAQLRHLARRRYRPVGLAEALLCRSDPAFLETNPIVLTFDGPSATFAAAVETLARYQLFPVVLFFPAALIGKPELRFAKGRPEPLLGPPDLARLAARGVELGLLCSDLAQKGEGVAPRLESDRRRLQDATGLSIEHLALPLAEPDKGVARAARDAGFASASLAAGDGILSPRCSPWALPRWNARPGQHLINLSYALAARRR